jgi:nicotinamide-nucleotide amidase
LNAEIIAVGSELLTPQRVDTNSLFITDQLNVLGIEVTMKTIAGDDRARLTAVIAAAILRSDAIVLTGGLGPTEDDVTRDAVGAALGLGQAYHPEVEAEIEARFKRAGRKMAENNKRQALILDTAEILPNDRGTAPGQWIEKGGRVVMLLPGPPNEMKPMFAAQCIPKLQLKLPPLAIRTRVYRVAGMPESDLDQLIAPVYTKYTNPATTILAAPSDIQIHLRARCSTEREAEILLAEVGAPIEELLGERIYSRNGDPLEAAVGALLRSRQVTLSVAESCTGGMLAEHITAVPGSSDYFLGGFLTYTDAMKIALLGVDPALIAQHTAVSEEVAIAMAKGAMQKTASNFALSVTGVAGPTGGSEANPVGTVFIGMAHAAGAEARRFRFFGDRSRIRVMTVQTALDWLRKKLG